LEIESYLRGLIARALNPPRSIEVKDALRNACMKTWGNPEKRAIKSLRILRMVGVHPTTEIKGRQVPDALVESIAALNQKEAFEYFSEKAI
jgi:hypothetical protein